MFVFLNVYIEALQTQINKEVIRIQDILNFEKFILISGVQSLISGVLVVLPGLLQTVVDTAVGLVPMCAQAILDMLPVLLETGLAMVEGLGQSILSAIPVLIGYLPVLIESVVAFILSAVPQIIETGISLFTALVSALPTIIDSIISVLPSIIDSAISTLLSLIPLLVETGISLFISLIQDLSSIVSTLTAAIPRIVDSLCSTFSGNIGKIVETGVKLFVSLIQNLPSAILEICKAAPQIVASLASAVIECVPSIVSAGTDLVKGLFNGISSAVSWLYGKLRGWVSSVLSYIKSLFGIHSPSKETAKFGEFISEGLGVGIEDNADAATDAAKTMGEKVLDTFGDVTEDIKNAQSDLFSGESADYEVKANVTADTSGAIASKLDSNVDITNSSLLSGLTSVFDRLLIQGESLGNRLVSAISNAGAVGTSAGSVTINLGNISVSGVVDGDAADTVNGFIENQLDEIIPVMVDYMTPARRAFA